MLRIFKARQYVVAPTDRAAYLKQWRSNNRAKITTWAKKYALVRKVQRQEDRMRANLALASSQQLEFALSQKNLI